MKKILFLLFAGFSFLTCKKNSVDETFTPVINPYVPDFTTQVMASVSGVVTNENGEAIAGANIIAGSVVTVTDQFGFFWIDSASFSKSIGLLKIEKQGYFSGFRSFLPNANQPAFIRINLLEKTLSGSINSSSGGQVSLATGAIIQLPADAVVIASNNTPYNGQVNLYAHWFNPADMQATNLSMPGNLTGLDSSGYLNTLTTFGMLGVELESASGEKLQIQAGKKAGLNFPLPAAVQAQAPASIPLWYFDETKGVWKQEGHATRNGNSYQGEVAHFSYWNCDMPNVTGSFSVQLVNDSLQPMVNIPVSVTIDGLPSSTRTGYTNANGFAGGYVPVNIPLTLSFSDQCNIVYTRNFTANPGALVNLGTIVITHPGAVSISGAATKCNGQPVTNGFVVAAGSNFFASGRINNGSYILHTLICQPDVATVKIFDIDDNTNGKLDNLPIAAGQNNIAAIAACNGSINLNTEFVTYTFDGSTTNLTLPFSVFTGNYNMGGNFTSLVARNQISNIIEFYTGFDGSGVGGYSLAGNLISFPSGDYQYLAPSVLYITRYGLVGQFITGNYSGQMKKIPDNSIHNYSFQFNIKRDQ